MLASTRSGLGAGAMSELLVVKLLVGVLKPQLRVNFMKVECQSKGH